MKGTCLERSTGVIRGDVQLSEVSNILGSEEAGPDMCMGSSSDPSDKCKEGNEPRTRMRITGTEKYLRDRLQPPH